MFPYPHLYGHENYIVEVDTLDALLTDLPSPETEREKISTILAELTKLGRSE